MGTISIAYPNRGPQGVLSGGAWQRALSALQTRPLGDVARSAGLAATWFDIDLQRHRAISFLSLVRHNLSVGARVRVTAGSSAGRSDLYDSGWVDAWPPVRSVMTSPWLSENWWNGRLTADERLQYPSDFVLQFPVILCRYMRVEISDLANSAGYVEIGLLFLSDAWRPVVNMDWDCALGWQDKSIVEDSDSGQEFFGQRPKRRRFSFRLSHMTTDAAMCRAFDLDGALGVSGDVYLMVDADDTLHRVRRSFLGRMEQTTDISHVSYERHVKPYTIVERIA